MKIKKNDKKWNGENGKMKEGKEEKEERNTQGAKAAEQLGLQKKEER